jgi:hypothetical protein
VPPPGQPGAVLVAGEPLVEQVGGGLRQRQRQVPQLRREGLGAVGQVRVPGELLRQVRLRLGGREQADVDRAAAVPAQRRVPAPGGDDHPARGGVRWPQLPHVGRVRDVVEHHEPPQAGLGEPRQQPPRTLVRVLPGGSGECGGDGRVTGLDRLPRLGGEPHEQVQRAVAPQPVRVVRRQLRLADAAEPGQHVRAGVAGELEPGGPRPVAVRQRRHDTEPARPRRSAALLVHDDELRSRVHGDPADVAGQHGVARDGAADLVAGGAAAGGAAFLGHGGYTVRRLSAGSAGRPTVCGPATPKENTP